MAGQAHDPLPGVDVRSSTEVTPEPRRAVPREGEVDPTGARFFWRGRWRLWSVPQ